MSDLKSPTMIYLKGWLFLASALIAAGLILYEVGSLRICFLLFVSIWCFARFYYFAFYVIEHYVDSDFKYAGLASFLQHQYSVRRNARQK